jgi:hypothetical protein
MFVAVMYACDALGLRVVEFVGYAGSGKRSLSHHPTLSNRTPQKNMISIHQASTLGHTNMLQTIQRETEVLQ